MQFAPTLPLVVFVSEKGATTATDSAHLVAVLLASGGTFRAQNHVVAGNYKPVAIGAAYSRSFRTAQFLPHIWGKSRSFVFCPSLFWF